MIYKNIRDIEFNTRIKMIKINLSNNKGFIDTNNYFLHYGWILKKIVDMEAVFDKGTIPIDQIAEVWVDE